MQILEMVSESTGEVLDVITLSGSNIAYQNGSAEPIIIAKRGIYQSNKKAFFAIAGTSNGYVSFRMATDRLELR